MGNERNQYVLFEPKERNCHWAESSFGMDKTEIASWSLSCELTVAADGKTVKFIEWGIFISPNRVETRTPFVSETR